MSRLLNKESVSWRVHANEVVDSNDSNITFSARDGSGVMVLLNSALKPPVGVSGERPTPAEAGMFRYNTDINLLELYNGTDWYPIQLYLPPFLSNISPNDFDSDISNSFVLTGGNFSVGVGTHEIEFIGQSSTVYMPTISNVANPALATCSFYQPNSIFSASYDAPFSVKFTNLDTGAASTLSNAVAWNESPGFIAPFGPFGPFAVQDPSATFTIKGTDTNQSGPVDLSFSIISGGPNPGDFVLTNVDDISGVFAPSAGSRTSDISGTYNFTARLTDSSGGYAERNYSFSLADPIVTSVAPSVGPAQVLDISVNGNYFVVDDDHVEVSD